MYITRFIRRDQSPNEDYYYHTIEEARHHLNLFLDDDSDLYDRIEIINDCDLPVETLNFTIGTQVQLSE